MKNELVQKTNFIKRLNFANRAVSEFPLFRYIIFEIKRCFIILHIFEKAMKYLGYNKPLQLFVEKRQFFN